jgi:hypothetical protein
VGSLVEGDVLVAEPERQQDTLRDRQARNRARRIQPQIAGD